MEARPDLVRNIPEGGSGGSPSKESGEDHDESSKDGGGGSENPSAESQPPPTSQSSESNNLENQPLEDSGNFPLGHEATLHVLPGAFTKRKPIVPPEALTLLILECFLRSYLHHISISGHSSLYIILNPSMEFRQAL